MTPADETTSPADVIPTAAIAARIAGEERAAARSSAELAARPPPQRPSALLRAPAEPGLAQAPAPARSWGAVVLAIVLLAHVAAIVGLAIDRL